MSINISKPTPGALSFPRSEPSKSLSIHFEWDQLDRRVSDLSRDTAHGRKITAQEHLEAIKVKISRKPVSDVLNDLVDTGFSWRDIARVLNVSVPALKKWRNSSGISGDNRAKLSTFSALMHILHERIIDDPVSWLEMPIRHDVQLNAMDLLASGRHDLVLELSRLNGFEDSTLQVLDSFDPDWRDKFRDQNFSVSRNSEGYLAIVPEDSHGK